MTDFRRAIRLILSTAHKPVDDRTATQTRDDLIYCLEALRGYRMCPGAVDDAIRFVQSEAWPMIYTRYKLANGYPRLSATSESVVAIDSALDREFSNYGAIPNSHS